VTLATAISAFIYPSPLARHLSSISDMIISVSAFMRGLPSTAPRLAGSYLPCHHYNKLRCAFHAATVTAAHILSIAAFTAYYAVA